MPRGLGERPGQPDRRPAIRDACPTPFGLFSRADGRSWDLTRPDGHSLFTYVFANSARCHNAPNPTIRDNSVRLMDLKLHARSKAANVWIS